MIESAANAKFKRIQKLMKQARARKKEGVFVVEGWKMVREALQRDLVQELYCDEKEEQALAKELAKLQKRPVIEVLKTTLFKQMSDTVNPQGVLAVITMPSYDREQMISSSEFKLLCLENIQDPGNLGTMFRTAEGAGMSGVVLSSGCVDLFNPKVVRSTMGAMFRVPFYICESMSEEMKQLQNQSFHFYAAHLQGKKNFREETYDGRIGILIGNEANGLSDEVTALADKKVIIPMEGELESLNAAVSAALLMYEVQRNKQL